MFCIAGMQQFKDQFRDPTYNGTTLCNVQGCIRLDDLNEIGDGTHSLFFHMLGMFSFRQQTVQDTINLWLTFLTELGIRPDYVTVHPDRPHWSRFYPPGLEVREDKGCTWGDGGGQTGYCTEFFVGDLEIGNIVNPGGDCIDVGFGLERLCLVLGDTPPTTESVLIETVSRIIDSGFEPGNKKQGYVLRRLLRRMVQEGIRLDHPFWEEERGRQEQMLQRYERLKNRHRDKTPDWWWDTHGIDITLVGSSE